MRYLSNEWVQAADRAVKAAAATAPQQTLIIDQQVADALDYRIVIGPSPTVEVINEPPAASADATFSQSLETATAVAQETTDAHQQFLLGHIRFHGDINLLIERRDAFNWLQAALAPLLAKTTFG